MNLQIEKRSATKYRVSTRYIKRSKTQARRGVRGFSTGAYIDVREQEKRSATKYRAAYSPFFILRRRREDPRYDKRFVRHHFLQTYQSFC